MDPAPAAPVKGIRQRRQRVNQIFTVFRHVRLTAATKTGRVQSAASPRTPDSGVWHKRKPSRDDVGSLSEDLASINQRLDELTRQLDKPLVDRRQVFAE